MCGIAGIADVTGRPVSPVLLEAMTHALAHRGPDGEAVLCRGRVGLGHRRLAIIDLVTGDQPVQSDDGALAIVFNGEIYNFREVRAELAARGARFHTASDTEVILRAYEMDGPACVSSLRGMFAFAILDGRARRLFLARDRVGIKPLHYAWDGRRLVFASELKAILEDPDVPRDLDLEALGEYLIHHYISAPRTIFLAIRKLPPASTLLLPLDGGRPEIARYWDLRFAPDPRISEQEWIERLRAELADAVRSHMVSDVPIGAFLSGGLDSSTVVALMARASARPVRTFSIGFDEADFDELRFARQVAARYGTDHYELVVKPKALEALPRLVWHFDEPFADASAIPTYYVAKITREHVTVALSGDGGDENFAGYRRYARAAALAEMLDRGPRRLLRALLRGAAALLPTGARGQAWAGLLGSRPLERYFRLMTYQRPETLRRLLARDLAGLARMAAVPGPFARLAEASGAADYVSRLQYVDIQHYLPEDILTKVDRASMAVSLESRVPLLDHRLMEFLARMPASLKFRDGAGKWALKRAMASALPEPILTRPKMGFGVPLGDWLRGELRETARDLLLGPRFRQRGLFRPAEVARLLEEHDSGRRDRSARLWALMVLELWMREWMDRPPVARPGGG
jgi:asparagine synthase (glutamine-hydrolysing)